MEISVNMRTERKIGRQWVEQSFTDDKTRVYKQLAEVLRARYISQAKWVTRINHRTNYDGTYTYTVYYGNGWRDIIRADF